MSNIKTFSSKFRFECNFCGYQTNSKKKFSEHRFFPSHFAAVVKKNKESNN